MQIKKAKKGQKLGLPCLAVGGKDGWTLANAPCNGIVIQLNAREKSAGGTFISDQVLEKNGYKTGRKTLNLNPILKKLEKKYTKYDLVIMINEFGLENYLPLGLKVTKNTKLKKAELAKIYLEGLLK